MDTPNAFVGHAAQPTDAELAAVLGAMAPSWDKLVNWLATERGVAERQWKSSSLKYGWSLELKMKTRTIVHLGPCVGCFRAAFVLGDRAVANALQSNLPKPVIQAIAAAPKYAEGTGVRLLVKKPGDLAAIRKLAEIKLAY